MPCNLLLKIRQVVLGVRNENGRHVLREFIGIWLGLGLYLMHAVAEDGRGCRFLHLPCFCLLAWPCASLSTLPQLQKVCVLQDFQLTHCPYTGAQLWWSGCREGKPSNVMSKSQSFSGPVSLTVTFTSVSAVVYLSPPHLGETGRLWGLQRTGCSSPTGWRCW